MTLHTKPESMHSCVMVYRSGAREELPRLSSQIRIWVLSNRTFHPTAALFVDGKCRYRGRFSDEEITKLEGELQ